jgi:hypothetical protein
MNYAVEFYKPFILLSMTGMDSTWMMAGSMFTGVFMSCAVSNS